MGSFNQSRRLKNLQNLKSGAMKLPRHWSKMLGLVNISKATIEELFQVSISKNNKKKNSFVNLEL